jgi:hypothetical protein
MPDWIYNPEIYNKSLKVSMAPRTGYVHGAGLIWRCTHTANSPLICTIIMGVFDQIKPLFTALPHQPFQPNPDHGVSLKLERRAVPLFQHGPITSQLRFGGCQCLCHRR